MRAALVLCAEHELNVSAFAARVVASTGAHLHATVCSGLAALSGPRHGGATARAYALIESACAAHSPRDFIAARWRQGEDLPGFGHALYPNGDPRAAELLARLRARHANSPGMRGLEAIISATGDINGQRPNVDFTLAAICHLNALPAAPALVMFASARLAGWLAHALEQQAQGRLIRPRASYTSSSRRRWIESRRPAPGSTAGFRAPLERPLHFIQRVWIIQGGEIAGIRPLSQRLQRAPQQLAGAGLGQCVDDVDARRSCHRAQALLHGAAHAFGGAYAFVRLFGRLAQRREHHRHLAFQLVTDANHRSLATAGKPETDSSISRVPRRCPATLMTSSVRPRMKV